MASIDGLGFDPDVLASYRLVYGAGREDRDDDAIPTSNQPVDTRVQRASAPLIDPSRPFICCNPCSTQWRWERVEANPAMLPAIYIGGMIGYALSLPIRIVILAVAILRFVLGPILRQCSSSPASFSTDMKARGLVMLGALGELGSGVIGVVCPPLAYYLDEQIQANETIHRWYRNNWMSVRSNEFDEPITGNAERVALKKEAISGDVKYFQRAQKDLDDNYLEKGETIINEGMFLVIRFGLLDLMVASCESQSNEHIVLDPLLKGTCVEHTVLAKYCQKVLERCPEEEKLKTKNQLINAAMQFQNCWTALLATDVLKSQESQPQTLTDLGRRIWRRASVELPPGGGDIRNGIQASLLLKASEEGQGTEKLNFKDEQIQGKLEERLGALRQMQVDVGGQLMSTRQVVEKMAGIIISFTGILTSVDREMLTLLIQVAQS